MQVLKTVVKLGFPLFYNLVSNFHLDIALDINTHLLITYFHSIAKQTILDTLFLPHMKFYQDEDQGSETIKLLLVKIPLLNPLFLG